MGKFYIHITKQFTSSFVTWFLETKNYSIRMQSKQFLKHSDACQHPMFYCFFLIWLFLCFCHVLLDMQIQMKNISACGRLI
jgi:hypothetical protein